MHEIFHWIKLVLIVLLVPVLPFLVLGGALESWFHAWQQSPPSPAITATIVIALLATDVFLPIPSSLVSTLAGSQLGVVGGTAAWCLGMTLGGMLGFGLARRWGPAFVRRFAADRDLEHVQQVARRYGPGFVVLLRGVPLLAEASVLVLGLHGLTWRRFLPPLVLSNLGIALAYAKFGQYAEEHEWLPAALGISLALPLLVALAARWWFGAARQGRST